MEGRSKTHRTKEGFVSRFTQYAINIHCRGVYDDRGRLMMMINYNSDIGDAWEHSAESFYPRQYADMAYRMGINAVIYALTH